MRYATCSALIHKWCHRCHSFGSFGAHSKFWVVAGSEDFACATLPTTPIDFQGKIKNLCHPTLQKIRSKITVIPSPPPSKKRAKSKLQCFNKLQIHLPKSLWGNIGVLQHQVSPNQTFSQQNMGTQPVYHITNFKTMCLANFRIWLNFNHNNIGHNHQQKSMAPEQVIWFAPHLPKYISVKLLHDSSGLPYVKIGFSLLCN